MYPSKVTYADVLHAGLLDSLCSVCSSQTVYQSARAEMELNTDDLRLCHDCKEMVLKESRIKTASRIVDQLKAKFLDYLGSEIDLDGSSYSPVLVVLPTGESLTVEASVDTWKDNFLYGQSTTYYRFRLPEVATSRVNPPPG